MIGPRRRASWSDWLSEPPERTSPRRPAIASATRRLRVLSLHRTAPVSPHLEVETDTWDVLPEDVGAGSLYEAVARVALGAGQTGRMTLDTIVRLGRISNLPTVWTNALAGAVLATGGLPEPSAILIACLALTLFYEGGMWLNDAFDAEIDARERANRPIPNREIARSKVFLGGGLMLASGLVVAFASGGAAGLVGIGLCLRSCFTTGCTSARPSVPS